MIATERIYLDKTRTKVVPESEGAFLLVGKGGFLSDKIAAQYGLLAPDAPIVEVAEDPVITIGGGESKTAPTTKDGGKFIPIKQ